MKITKMRFKNELPSTDKILSLVHDLEKRLAAAGFISGVQFGESRSNLKIGLHMRSFSIDINKLGYNARFNSFYKTKTGFKRTNVPTWDQRVEFNNIINACFDRAKISAKIVSGPFSIRTIEKGACDESDWLDQEPNWANRGTQYNGMGMLVSEIVTLNEALERMT